MACCMTRFCSAAAEMAAFRSCTKEMATLMATMQAPIGQFVRTLNEVPARFVRTVAAVRDAKEKAAA